MMAIVNVLSISYMEEKMRKNNNMTIFRPFLILYLLNTKTEVCFLSGRLRLEEVDNCSRTGSSLNLLPVS
jgi:hypothetical protein